MASGLVLLAAVLALVALMHQHQEALAAPGIACPNCDFKREEFRAMCADGPMIPSTNARSKMCVGLFDNETYCDAKADRSRTSMPIGLERATNLTSNSQHCGKCNNRCPTDQPYCEGGECACPEGRICDDRSATRICDGAENKCSKSCPEGFAHCGGSVYGAIHWGDEACDVNLRNTTGHCGACFNECPPGHTCEDGRCVCGETKDICAFPQRCINDKCAECSYDSSDSTCQRLTVFDDSRFCSAPGMGETGECKQCPLNMGDCLATNVDGGPDSGVEADCETNLNTTGVTNHCGTCGGRCGATNSAQSCCQGECKCGVFTDNANPSADECAVAEVCGLNQYCDAKLQRCVGLDPRELSCSRTAANPSDVNGNNFFDSVPFCGSCDRAEGLKNIINGTCFSGDAFSFKCGGEMEECEGWQTCSRARCQCSAFFPLNRAFGWNKWFEEDPDKYNRLEPNSNRPKKGCDGLSSNVVDGHFVRAQMTLLKLKSCADKSYLRNATTEQLSSISPPDLKNQTILDQICPPDGPTGTCPPSFCQDIVRNLTGYERKDFCREANWYAAHSKQCTQQYPGYDGKGAPACSNVLAKKYSSENPKQFTWLEMYAFLGCDERRDDFVYHFDPAERGDRFLYRGELAHKLFASGMALRATLISMVVLLVSAIVAVF